MKFTAFAGAMLLMACVPTHSSCPAGMLPGTRIDYDVSIPAMVVAMAPWSEVERAFPDVRGVTRRTVLVAPDRMVEIQRGRTLKATVSKDIMVPAPGVHLRDQRGEEITFIGYEAVPLLTLRIQTRTERIRYSSTKAKARRTPVSAPDSDLLTALTALENTAEPAGERDYGGAHCMAKRVPMHGARSETCVRDFHGWPVALQLQFDAAERGGLQWYRATSIRESACMPEAELRVPDGVPIEEDRRRLGLN